MTETYAVLKVSPQAWDEIETKLREAGLDHRTEPGTLDMAGLALVKEGPGDDDSVALALGRKARWM